MWRATLFREFTSSLPGTAPRMRLWVPTGVTGSVAGLAGEACMQGLLCPPFWQYCSNCTRWTPYSLGVAALDMHGHFDFYLG